MKKVYTVIAALMLISAMASCSGVESGKASSQITGTWKYTIDITDDFDQMSMDLIGSPTDATVEMVYAITFNEDGTYSLYIDRDAVKASIQAYLEKMENTFYAEMDQEAEKIFQSSSLSPEETEKYRQAYLAGRNNTDETAEEFVARLGDGIIMEGYFRADGGRLYVSKREKSLDKDECTEYVLSSDGTMTWTGGNNDLIKFLEGVDVQPPVRWVKQ